MSGRAYLGLDLGGSKVLAALFDEKLRPVESLLHRSEPDKGLRLFSARLDESVQRLAARARRERLEIQAVGAGCAGFIDAESGALASCPNIPFIRDFPIAARLRRATGCPVFVGNDAQMGLYGEFKLGAAALARNVIGLFLGTGIGGAIILEGRLYQGSSGLAGEIGHYLLDALGPLSGSGRQGLFDDIASRHAVAAQAAALAAKQWAPALFREAGANLLDIRADVMARAIRKGDAQLEELVRSRASVVGLVLANLVNFLNPDMVVLGGGLVKALGDIIVPEAEKTMRRHALAPIARVVRVVPARLGDLAVATGAARWALDALTGAAAGATLAASPAPPHDRRASAPSVVLRARRRAGARGVRRRGLRLGQDRRRRAAGSPVSALRRGV